MKRITIFLILSLCIFPLAGAQKQNAYEIFIDGESSRLYLLENGKPVKEYKCALGKYETPSPVGSFKIVQKEHWGEGFGGSWMGIDCPWGKFGIHGTIYPNSIGWHSSKGCFRMYNSDVAELYSLVPYATRVTIQNGPYGDFGEGFRHIKVGRYGSDVLRIQMRLAELGYYKGSADGIYGEGMKAAVQKYQGDNGLYVSNTITPEMQESLGFILME